MDPRNLSPDSKNTRVHFVRTLRSPVLTTLRQMPQGQVNPLPPWAKKDHILNTGVTVTYRPITRQINLRLIGCEGSGRKCSRIGENGGARGRTQVRSLDQARAQPF